jgi:hypothetical protein
MGWRGGARSIHGGEEEGTGCGELGCRGNKKSKDEGWREAVR